MRVLIAVGAVLVGATLIFRFRTPWFLWLAPLNLTEENVAAAWFSGILLLLASLLAADGYFSAPEHAPQSGLRLVGDRGNAAVSVTR